MEKGKSGSVITESNIPYPSKGREFIDEYGVIRKVTRFTYSDVGIPMLFWDNGGCFGTPAINLRLNKTLKWV
jgi:hypothetical protein